MSDNPNSEEEKNILFPVINVLIILTIILILMLPSILKLNKGCFIIGFIIAVFIMNLLLTFFKVLYYDNSWYTQKYQYNNSDIYKEAINDVVDDTKKGFYYYIDEVYNSFEIKNFFSSIYNKFFKPIGKGIKYIFYREPKSSYKPTRQKKNS